MSRFFRNALATFESFDKTFSSINKAFNDFANENKAFNDLMTRGKDLFGNVNGFVKEVHETLSDIKVEVPYDKVTDTLKYSTDNGTLDITVSSNDGTYNKFISTTIPDNAMVDKLSKTYDSEHKLITFVIPKKKDVRAIKNEKIRNLIKAYDTKKTALKNELNKAIQKINDELDDASSQSNKNEPLRDEKGRFVSKRKNEKSKK